MSQEQFDNDDCTTLYVHIKLMNLNQTFCRISLLGSGSDFAPFIKKVGVSCADLRYHFDDKLGISSYPLYHSVYETFYLVDKIMDPTFAVSCLMYIFFDRGSSPPC